MEVDERVIERNVCCMKKNLKKKKRKEANEWPAKSLRILMSCVVLGSGVGGVTHVAP